MDYLELQALEADDFWIEAYKDFLETAPEWKCAAPAVGSVDESRQMVESPPQAGNRVEATTASEDDFCIYKEKAQAWKRAAPGVDFVDESPQMVESPPQAGKKVEATTASEDDFCIYKEKAWAWKHEAPAVGSVDESPQMVQSPPQAGMRVEATTGSEDDFSIYKEKARAWKRAAPAVGSVDESPQLVQSPPQAGMRVEATTASATVPIHVGDMAAGPSCSASAQGTQQPAQASSGGDSIDFRKLHEANNICMDAYKELIRIAKRENAWVIAEPAIGSIMEIAEMFQNPPPDGMTVENSTSSAMIRTSPSNLASIMMNVDKWAESLVHIVCSGTGDVPKDVLQHLRIDDYRIIDARMVRAKFQLPTPFVPTRDFYFLRYLKEIMPNAYIIVDVSSDYFEPTTALKCRRRPSGLIIRKTDVGCQIIWVENVEVCEPKDNIYSLIINSNLAFGARRWISTLQWKLKRDRSKIVDAKMDVHERADKCLLELTKFMKMFYMACTASDPDEVKFSVVVGKRLTRVLKNRQVKKFDAYIALTSFQVQAKPQSVFQFLVKKNLQLQWPGGPNSKEPEELINFATNDNSNCITLHRKEKGQLITYCLQEASWDEYCSFVISSPMSQQDVDHAIGLGSGSDVFLQPSGFAIMPNGSEDLQSNGSLVTFVLQKQFKRKSWFKSQQIMRKLKIAVAAIIREIDEEIAGGGNDQS